MPWTVRVPGESIRISQTATRMNTSEPIPSRDLPTHPGLCYYLETDPSGKPLRSAGVPPEDFALTIACFKELGDRTAEVLGLGACGDIEVHMGETRARFGRHGHEVHFGALYRHPTNSPTHTKP